MILIFLIAGMILLKRIRDKRNAEKRMTWLNEMIKARQDSKTSGISIIGSKIIT